MHLQAVVTIGVLLATPLITACSARSESPGTGSRRTILPSPPLSPSEDGDSCVAADAQPAVGQLASETLLESSRVAAKARTARFLRPNQPVTMEFNGSRLNLSLDERGIVLGVNCG